MPETFHIETPRDFDFEALITRMGTDVLYQVRNGYLYRAVRLGDAEVLLRLGAGDGGIKVDLLSGEAASEAVARYVRDWFDLDRDLSGFYALEDGVIAPLIRRYRGLRMVAIPDLYEALCWAVIGQQVNLTFAHKVKKAFVEFCGAKISHDGMDYWRFPDPQAVAALDPDVLMPLQFSRRKAEYVIGIGQEIAEGRLAREALLGMASEEQARHLTAIRGVGAWTANYVMMKSLGEMTALPAGDAGLQNALKGHLGLGRKPSVAEIEAMAANWAPWQAYATYYLWRTLSDG